MNEIFLSTTPTDGRDLLPMFGDVCRLCDIIADWAETEIGPHSEGWELDYLRPFARVLRASVCDDVHAALFKLRWADYLTGTHPSLMDMTTEDLTSPKLRWGSVQEFVM